MPDDPEGPHARSPREARYTIAKQKHSRWWEVRGSADELVCSLFQPGKRSRRVSK
jgi:hypothetical protein